MALRCGIVGLPNVGKSTLFNALTQTMKAEASNYPFCTITPNIGRVEVPDRRLDKLAEIAKSKEILRSQIDFVDIAGLVRGASKGEGLGNQFLSNIREVDCLLNVVRCFDDEDISHVEKIVDPSRDIELVQTELILADMESLENRLQSLGKKNKAAGDVNLAEQGALMERILTTLNRGEPAINTVISPEEEKSFKMLQLLTAKKQFFVCNVGEEDIGGGNSYTEMVGKYCSSNNCQCIICSAKIESEIAILETEEEKSEFLDALGLSEKGLDRVIKTSYNLLDLISFFTVGPKEAHSWTMKRGLAAPKAAGIIHTDFERGFIGAETIGYRDYIECGGEENCKVAGKMRLEGREYIVRDGDIMHFRFNV
ncbi:MAG: redox-regulated ATPase YchF [Rickettsiales bacterium]|jgi:GTP-binding protein YchF|nr:redox-regulated ATPase YchF [Rickettsiales bacterium]